MLSYEIYSRVHQALGLFVAIDLWSLLFPESRLNKICAVTGIGILSVTAFLDLVMFFYQNNILKGLPKVQLQRVSDGTKAYITVRKRMRIKAGQYISICIPSTGLSTILQWHPFIVVDAQRAGEETKLTLLIQSRRGFTNKLLRDGVSRRTRTALIIGPYGLHVPIDEYTSVLMVASGLGILSHLPYLQYLVSGKGFGRSTRVTLLWQLKHTGQNNPEGIESTLTRQQWTEAYPEASFFKLWRRTRQITVLYKVHTLHCERPADIP